MKKSDNKSTRTDSIKPIKKGARLKDIQIVKENKKYGVIQTRVTTGNCIT